MSKDAYYFPHDSNARHDPKIVAMMSVYGFGSYGRYWVLIEMLREQKDYKYPLSKKYGYNSLAKELGLTTDEATKFIDDCVNEFDLFSTDGEFLWSDSLNQRMVKLDARKERASVASKMRWGKGVVDYKNPKGEAKTTIIDDEPPFTEVNPIKNGIDTLTSKFLFGEFMRELCEKEEFKGLSTAFLSSEKDKCLDWLKGKGTRKKDYKAFFRNWLRTAMKSMPVVEKKGMVF